MAKAPFTWRMLIRRGWLIAAACLIGTGVSAAVAHVSASSTDALHVSVQGAQLTPYQASRLALSYARLLPEDPSLLGDVARATGRTPADVRRRLTMSAQPATAVVFARFSAPTAGAALTGMQAVVAALGRAGDGAGSRLRATIAPLSDPTTTTGFSRTRALALGFAGGLLIGFALALALERRWPRVDDVRDLAQLVPLPVARVHERALPLALARIARRSAPATVELLPVAPARGGPALRHALAAASAQLDDGAGERARSFAAIVSFAAGERFAALPARTLVVSRGASAASVEDAWRAAGPTPSAVLLVDRTPRLRRLLGARGGVRAA